MDKQEKLLKLIANMKIDVENLQHVVNKKKSINIQLQISDAILRKLNKINSIWGVALKSF